MDRSRGVSVDVILPLVIRPGSNWHMLYFNSQQYHNKGVFQEVTQDRWLFVILCSQQLYQKPLEYTLLRQSMPKIHGASGPVTIECFSHLSPVKLTSVSNTDNCWHLPVTPVIQVGSVPYTLMAPVYAVHQCLPDPYTSVDLMCQATESRES